jgi:hypothetical protein
LEGNHKIGEHKYKKYGEKRMHTDRRIHRERKKDAHREREGYIE